VDADGVQNPLTVLPTRLGLSVRAIDGPAATSSGGYSQLSTGSAPFQSAMGGEAFQVGCLTTSFFLEALQSRRIQFCLPWNRIRNLDIESNTDKKCFRIRIQQGKNNPQKKKKV
jgi:hypothetical protein